MGKAKKSQPLKLPEKLLVVRKFFDLSQEEMIEFVIPDVEDAASARAAISDYESGRRAPSILESLNYAITVRLLSRHKQFNVEDLIDDKRELPFSTSASVKSRRSEISLLKTPKIKPDKPVEIEETIEPETIIKTGSDNEAKSDSENKSSNAKAGEIKAPVELLSEGILGSENQMTATEDYAVDLPKKTFSRIDDIRLDLLKQTPHFWRPKLTEEIFIELLLDAVAAEYDEGRGSSSIVEKLKTKLRELPPEISR